MEPISDSEHYGAGSTEPVSPADPNVIRLYSMRFCPYAQRARLVLSAKKAPHDIINIDIKSKPEWYPAKSLLGKVPCIEIKGKQIFESIIIADLVDELYPGGGSLHPADPVQKALDKIQLELFNQLLEVTAPLYKLFLAKGTSEEAGFIDSLFKGLDHFEAELARRNTSFFGGSKPMMLDYMIWPWFERIAALPWIIGETGKFPTGRFTHLEGWMERMIADPVVEVSYFPPEVQGEFTLSYMAGTPNYDLGKK